MRLIAQHTRTGRDRMTLQWTGGMSWDVVSSKCRKEASAVVAHLLTLDPGDDGFLTHANDRLAKIGFTLRLSE